MWVYILDANHCVSRHGVFFLALLAFHPAFDTRGNALSYSRDWDAFAQAA
jgi:hypothetical protein